MAVNIRIVLFSFFLGTLHDQSHKNSHKFLIRIGKHFEVEYMAISMYKANNPLCTPLSVVAAMQIMSAIYATTCTKR